MTPTEISTLKETVREMADIYHEASEEIRRFHLYLEYRDLWDDFKQWEREQWGSS